MKNNSFMRMLKGDSGIIAILVIVFVILSFVPPVFLTTDNLLLVLRQVSNNMYLAFGIALAIILGGIDFSVGTCVVMCGMLTAGLMVDRGMLIVPAITMGLPLRTLAGFLNGPIVATLRVPALIVTIPMTNVAGDVACIYSGGRPIHVSSDVSTGIGARKLFGVLPLPVVHMTILIIISIVVLNKTEFDTYIFAIGDNRKSVRLSGIPTKRAETAVFTIFGSLTAFIGIVLSVRTYSGRPGAGEGYGLDVIAAYILGGISVMGGVGTISRTIFGTPVIGIISNGLNLIGLSSSWQLVMKDLIIVLAVAIGTRKGKGSVIKRIIRNAKERV